VELSRALALMKDMTNHCAGGDATLRMLDFAAHQSLVDEETPYQNEFLPRTSQRLAQRLLDTLNPLFTTRLSSVKSSELLKTVKSIFALALRFKTFAMISEFKSEFIWPDRSSVFDESYMEEAMPLISKHQLHIHSAPKTVMLVLVPGLRVYQHNSMLVEYSGFVKGGEQKTAESILISRAAVMTTG
jgi:hypothetical protein